MSGEPQPAPPDADPPSALTEGDEAALEAARTHDAALALPLVGLALFTPPLIGLFASHVAVLGAPLIVVYLFTAWAALILSAFALSRRLARAEAHRGAGGEGET